MTLHRRSARLGSRGCRHATALIAAVVALFWGGSAMAATQAMIVNPQVDEIIHKGGNPANYLINGTCHLATKVTVQIDANPPADATVKGAAWEYQWDLTAVAAGAHTVTVTPYADGLAGTAVTAKVDVSHVDEQGNNSYGSVMLLPSSVIAGVYAGRGATAYDSTAPYAIAIGLRAATNKAGDTVTGAILTNPTSAGQIWTFNLESINNDEAAANAIPFLFSIGGLSGLHEAVETIQATFLMSNGSSSPVVQRSVLIDPAAPSVNSGAAVTFPAKNLLRLAGTVQDKLQGAGPGPVSGIERVTIVLTSPGGVRTIQLAKLAYGANPGDPVAWTTDFDVNVGGTYTVSVVASDNAGNDTTDPTVPTIVVDRTAPVPVITAPATGTIDNGTVTITGTITEPNLLKWELLDGTTVIASGATAPVSFAWNTTTVPDWDHSLTLVATDVQQNVGVSTAVVLTVDNTPPVPRIDAPASGSHVSGVEPVTGVVTDAHLGSWMLYQDSVAPANLISSNGTGLATVTGSWDTTALPAGPHALILQGQDLAGNLAQIVATYTVDNVAPVVTNLAAAPTVNSTFMKGNITVTATITEANLKGWELSDNGVRVQTGTNLSPSVPITLAVANDGQHTYKLVATDEAGATGAQSITLTADSTTPVVTIASPAAGLVVGQSVRISASAVDANPDTWKIQDSGVDIAGASGTGSVVDYEWNTSGLSEGSHTIKVIFTDKANNAGEQTVSIVVDHTAPVISPIVVSPAEAGGFVKGTVNALATVSDAHAFTWEMRANAAVIQVGIAAAASADFNTVGSDGPITFSVVAIDAAGNTSSPVTTTVTADNGVPTVKITSPSDSDSVLGTVIVRGVANDPNLKDWAVAIDGTQIGTGSTADVAVSWNTAPQIGTKPVIRLTATDKSNNSAFTEISVKVVDRITVTIDVTPKFENPPKTFVTGVTAISATIGAGEGDVTKWVLQDNRTDLSTGSGISVAFNWDTVGVADGGHELRVLAELIGGVEAEGLKGVIVDNTAPVVTVSTPVDGRTYRGVVSVRADVVEANPKTWRIYWVQGALTGDIASGVGATPVRANWDTTGKSGAFAIHVEMIDWVGKTDDKSVAIIVDNTAPVVDPITVAPAPVSANSKLYVGGNSALSSRIVDDSDVTWVLTDNAGEITNPTVVVAGNTTTLTWDYPVPASGTKDGPHKFVLTVTDRVGNATAQSLDVVVDTQKPTLDLQANPKTVDPLVATAFFVKGTIKLKVRAADLGLQEWALTDNGTTLQTGTADADLERNCNTTGANDQMEHTFKLTARDFFGNQAEQVVTVISDNVKPVLDLQVMGASKRAGGDGVDYPMYRTVQLDLKATSDDKYQHKLDVTDNGSTKVLTDATGLKEVTGKYIIDWTGHSKDGDHVFTLTGSDKAGNLGVEKTFRFRVDTTSPVVVITSPTAKAYLKGLVRFTAGISEQNPFKWRVEARPLAGGTTVIIGSSAPYDPAAPGAQNTIDVNWDTKSGALSVPDGRYYLVVVATDMAGNENNVKLLLTTDNVLVTVDNTPPKIVTFDVLNRIAFVSGADKTYFITAKDPSGVDLTGAALPSVSVVVSDTNLNEWVVTENGANIKASNVATGSVPYSIMSHAENTRTYTLTVTDKAGNEASRDFPPVTLDNTMPAPTFFYPRNHVEDNAAPTVFGNLNILGTAPDVNLAKWSLFQNGALFGRDDLPDNSTTSVNRTWVPLESSTPYKLQLAAADKAAHRVVVTQMAHVGAPVVSLTLKTPSGGSVFRADGTAATNLTSPGSDVERLYVGAGTGNPTFGLTGFAKYCRSLTLTDTGTAIVDNKVVKPPYNASAAASGAVSVPAISTPGRHRLRLVGANSDQVGAQSPAEFDVTLDNAPPVLTRIAPINPPNSDGSFALGSVMTVIFKVTAKDSAVDAAPIRRLLSPTGQTVNAPDVALKVEDITGDGQVYTPWTYSLFKALTTPNLSSLLDGSASVSGDASTEYLVTWQLPIAPRNTGTAGFAYGRRYRLTIGTIGAGALGVRDIVGNVTSPDTGTTFRISLTR